MEENLIHEAIVAADGSVGYIELRKGVKVRVVGSSLVPIDAQQYQDGKAKLQTHDVKFDTVKKTFVFKRRNITKQGS